MNAIRLIDRSDRGRLDVTGPDRAKFLHNLTTNEVKRLEPGRGREAFVTSLQGKTLGFVTLLADADRIVLRTDPGALGPLLPHLEKYGLFDDVALDDASARTFELHLLGPGADALLGAERPAADDLSHVVARYAGATVRLVRESPAGVPGLTIIGDRADAEAVTSAFREAGAGLLDPAEFEALRIAAGTPVFGRDLTADNLPQELGRDARAISFVKGCYLGQETVARIDALGHVNKLLKGLIVEGPDVPAPGTLLSAGGKPAGAITSAARDARGRVVALAYVRAANAAAGTTLELPGGAAAIADLPIRD